jgi:hypothetical protein
MPRPRQAALPGGFLFSYRCHAAQRGARVMRSVTEYLLKALELDGMAAETTDAALKTRYVDLAACYRLLAAERQRLIIEGTIPRDE